MNEVQENNNQIHHDLFCTEKSGDCMNEVQEDNNQIHHDLFFA